MNRRRTSTAAIGIFATLLFLCGRVAAQEIGVKGGLSIARLYVKGDRAKEKSLRGFSCGVTLGLRLTHVLSMRYELLYVHKGTSLGESEGTDASGNPTGRFETLHAVDYVEIPVLFNLSVPPSGRMRFGVVLGPAVAFEVSERIKTTGSTEQSVDADRLKNVDVCIAAGLELGLRSGPGHWSLETRYTTGLDTLDRPGEIDGRTRTGTTTIVLGYAFPLGDRPDLRR